MYPDNMVEVHVRAYLYRWQAKDVSETQGLHYQVLSKLRAEICALWLHVAVRG